MAIDKSYRTNWSASGVIRGLQVWTSDASEGKIYGTRVGVHGSSCIGCMKCIEACPTDVFIMAEEDANIIAIPENERNCILCNACELVCPTDAISVIQEGGSQETLDSLLRGSS
ncbi:4Fe-4S dicluster domain-containing protein [Candidatus Thorarchaeota archaeon]|nr:MAG: 4Fe-4S dicluster domain-containing protein [Candidatus Thorarchaeota archaeon]